jgi:peptidoglycan/LPS O-acetylase OafA/YrhL
VLAWKSRNITRKAYNQNLLDHSLRRYFKLLPPLLFTFLSTYLVVSARLTYNVEYSKVVQSNWLSQYLKFESNIIEAVKQSFYGVYFNFKSGTTNDPNLWTIGHEIISSYLLFGAIALFGRGKKSLWLFLILALLMSPWKGVMCFMIGAFLTRLPEHKAHPFLIGFLYTAGFYLSDLNGSN